MMRERLLFAGQVLLVATCIGMTIVHLVRIFEGVM